MRCASTRVLPLPAPARISSGPSPCVTASRWGSLRPSSSSWMVLGVRVLGHRTQHRCARGRARVQPPAGFGPVTVRSGLTSAIGSGSASESSATHAFERRDAAGERLDRLGDRVRQVDPVGVGALDAAPVDAHRMAGVADDRRVRRHVGDDDAVGADLGAVADRDRAEQLRAGADRDVVLHRRVALAGREAGAAERDALVERDVVADRRPSRRSRRRRRGR